MPESQPLPASKFSPRPLGPNQLQRRRLMDVLERHAHAKLVMIHAPAGYGKTTLMAQWHAQLAASGQGTGWVALDDDDNNAGRLVTALSRALCPRTEGHADLFDAVNLALQAHEYCTLFLDEEERVTAADAQHLLEVLLQLSPPNLHFVVGSRSQPQKLATRLRIRSDFLELSARELAFRPDEISQFIRLRCGITLEPQAEAHLARRTEGWAAVLQLAAADMARGQSPRTLFDRSAAPSADLFQYLSDEVLVRLRPEQHEFLLQTAFVDELSGPLCDAITGRSDSAAMLLELHQSNLLLQAIDPARTRFRYHALFADLLRRQLRERYPELLPSLARRAAAWCEQNGCVESAVEYALLAGDTEHLIRCMRKCTEQLITRAQFETARRWLRAIAPEVLREHADLLIWSTWVDIYTNDFASARLSIAELRSVQSSRALEDKDLLGDAIVRALLAVLDAHYDEALAAAEQAWQHVSPADPRMMAAVCNVRALLEQMRGRFSESAQNSERVLALAGKSPPIWLSFVHGAHISGMMEMSLGNLAGAWRQLELPERRMAETEPQREPESSRSQLLALLSGPRAFVLYELNKLEDAEDSLERYEPFLNTMFSPSSRALWHQLRVRLRALRDDEDACQEALAEGCAFAARHGISWMQDMMQWERVEHDGRRGDIHRARAVASGLLDRTPLHTAPRWIAPCEELFGPTVSALRFLIRAGEHRQALNYLPVHIAHAERQARRLRLTSLRLLEALAYRAAGEHAAALHSLRRALTFGQPSGAIRVFLDEGVACRTLLCDLERDQQPDAEVAEYLARLRAAFEDTDTGHAGPAAAAGSLPEKNTAPEGSGGLEGDPPNADANGTPAPVSLSRRERQILARLAEGCSNMAVGQQLFLSPNTVKWHLSQIYAKLGVRNRMQAVHVARQQQLTEFS